ncbi:MAG: ComEC/Rec2 family competence protein [Lentisphaerae bacterium]|nr:ComEC/Rec2 family competence protein [Lentisphaerota bacterium]MCP4100305.1 ComEC/Rec2 family competence protein [Lentisphaerota bacterium]
MAGYWYKRLLVKGYWYIKALSEIIRQHTMVGVTPSFLVFLGILDGIFPQLLFDDVSPGLGILMVMPLALISILLLRRREALVFTLAVIAGFLALNLKYMQFQRSFTEVLGNRDRGAEVVLRINDTACCGKDIKWLDNPSLITAEVLKIKLNGEKDWLKTSGRTAVRLPEGASKVFYGDIIKLKGTFRDPSNYMFSRKYVIHDDPQSYVSGGELLHEPVPGSADFVDYLNSRGIQVVLQGREFLGIEGSKPRIYGPILKVRNWLLRMTIKGIEDLRSRRLLATLLFGCRQGLDFGTKNSYIKSGTVHIFTVSGLHVGILALILMWFLRWVPFRTRHVIIPFIVLLYALATGMHPPASRALLMITIWCFCRAALLKVPPLNVVFLAASVLLLKNPFYMKDMGFQFSFVVVGFLIAAADGMHEWSKFPGEVLLWIPPSHRHWLTVLREKWLRKFNLGLVGCLTAWLASSGICLYYQGIYFPFSIVANFLLIPFVWLLFNFIFAKLFVSIIPFMVYPAALAVTTVLNFIDGIILFSHYIFESTSAIRPSISGMLFFYGALIMMVSARKRAWFFSGMAAIIAVVLYWHFANRFMPPTVMLMRGGGSQETAVVLADPENREAVVINVPSFEAAKTIVAKLGERGIRRIEYVAFTGSTKAFSAGAGTLRVRVGADNLIQMNPVSRSRNFKKTVSDMVAKGAKYLRGKRQVDKEGTMKYLFSSPQLEITSQKDIFDIEYHLRALHIKVLNNNGKYLIKIGGRKLANGFIKNGSYLEIREYVIK